MTTLSPETIKDVIYNKADQATIQLIYGWLTNHFAAYADSMRDYVSKWMQDNPTDDKFRSVMGAYVNGYSEGKVRREMVDVKELNNRFGALVAYDITDCQRDVVIRESIDKRMYAVSRTRSQYTLQTVS